MTPTSPIRRSILRREVLKNQMASAKLKAPSTSEHIARNLPLMPSRIQTRGSVSNPRDSSITEARAARHLEISREAEG